MSFQKLIHPILQIILNRHKVVISDSTHLRSRWQIISQTLKQVQQIVPILDNPIGTPSVNVPQGRIHHNQVRITAKSAFIIPKKSFQFGTKTTRDKMKRELNIMRRQMNITTLSIISTGIDLRGFKELIPIELFLAFTAQMAPENGQISW